MTVLPRHPNESLVHMTELVLPQHTNTVGSAFGGAILSWIDIAGGICAGRHAGRTAVTVAVDDVHFITPVRLGDVLNITARITFVGRTSMEVWVDVARERYDGNSEHANTAFVTFVAVNAAGEPQAVPPLLLDNDDDRRRHEEGRRRRDERLDRARRSATHPAA